jgi:sialidase-1
MTSRLLLSLVLASVSAALIVEQAPTLDVGNTTTVFKRGDCSVQTGKCYFCFRIPAIKRLPSGALLAFAEGRNNTGCNDYFNVSIVVRKSTDGGVSWGDITEVAAPLPSDIKIDPNRRIGNPSPIVDATTGRVYVLFAMTNQYAFVTHSDDEGHSWSPRSTLDPACVFPPTPSGGCRASPLCCLFGPGVGGGTQLASGRLITLAEFRSTGYFSMPIYSDDHGATWQSGAVIPDDNNTAHGIGEPSIALLHSPSPSAMDSSAADDMTLVMSSRSADQPCISFSVSENAGRNWSMAHHISEISNGGCQSPIIGMLGRDGAVISSPVYAFNGPRYCR